MIRLLDQQTVGVIAAGEVIERPLSVVKELVENALDAGAGRIVVRVRGGGIEALEVVDDGDGIAPDQLTLALTRHATSKLFAAGDLQRVRTLGFRGEGLASIAAVARVRVVSRTRAAEFGASVEAHAETVGVIEPAAAPVGTRVVATDLFANVPVRRDFLRSPGAEFTRISTWLATMSLAYPQVTFSLWNDDREAWTLPTSSSLEMRLAHVFGPSAAGLISMQPLETAHDVGVSGYVSAPHSDRADRRMQVLFVNGRLLRSTLASGAWTAGYSTFTMVGRHPYGVVFLNIPPDHLDPNVHPTKSDVRLRYDRAVHETLRTTIAATLRAHARERLTTSISFAPTTADVQPFSQPQIGFELEVVAEDEPRYRVLAQIDATYVLATDGRAIVLVDQHAAHERIAYEAIVEGAGRGTSSEPLLIPFEFSLDAASAEIVESSLDTLRVGGLDIEPFGDRVYRIVATPAGYRSAWHDLRREFDIADFIADLSDAVRGLSREERIFASLACHSVVRAGDRLGDDEMNLLVRRLEKTRNPMHCPHGRPTIVRLEPSDLARLFKRA